MAVSRATARRMTRGWALGWLACAFFAASAASASAAPAAGFTAAQVARVDRALRLIQARLDLAPRTAETRWQNMGRIEDHAAESALLDRAGAQAARLGLDTAFALAFAAAQIEAGKMMQAARHKQWATDSGAAPKREPATTGYKAVDAEPEISADLLAAARDAAAVLRRPGGRRLLDARAADLIRVGGQDLLAGQVALKPLYDIAR